MDMGTGLWIWKSYRYVGLDMGLWIRGCRLGGLDMAGVNMESFIYRVCFKVWIRVLMDMWSHR
jgi:hypothetical protein